MTQRVVCPYDNKKPQLSVLNAFVFGGHPFVLPVQVQKNACIADPPNKNRRRHIIRSTFAMNVTKVKEVHSMRDIGTTQPSSPWSTFTTSREDVLEGWDTRPVTSEDPRSSRNHTHVYVYAALYWHDTSSKENVFVMQQRDKPAFTIGFFGGALPLWKSSVRASIRKHSWETVCTEFLWEEIEEETGVVYSAGHCCIDKKHPILTSSQVTVTSRTKMEWKSITALFTVRLCMNSPQEFFARLAHAKHVGVETKGIVTLTRSTARHFASTFAFPKLHFLLFQNYFNTASQTSNRASRRSSRRTRSRVHRDAVPREDTRFTTRYDSSRRHSGRRVYTRDTPAHRSKKTKSRRHHPRG